MLPTKWNPGEWSKLMRFTAIRRSILMAAPLIVMLAACNSDTTDIEVSGEPRDSHSIGLGDYRLVQTSATTFELSNSKVIGPAGGVLYLGLHQLIVPRGAVNADTRFTMTTKPGNNVIVDLNASDLATGQPVTQFPVLVQLKLSYLQLGISRSNAGRLTILWLKDDSPTGELVPVKTTVQPLHAIGWLSHFSQFAMGLN